MSQFQIFDPQPVQETLDPEKSALDQLVGEGKKFSDAEALAKGKFQSDNHIKTLEAELALLRKEHSEVKEELSKNKTANEIFEEIRRIRPEAEAANNQQTTVVENREAEEVNLNDAVSQAVKEALSVMRTEEQSQSNLSKSMTALTEKFGDQAQTVLNQKSQQLGMTMDQLKTMAAENSTAFLALVGASPVTQGETITNTPSMPTSTQSTELSKPEKKGYSYYEKMRKEDPVRYRSPEVQNEMFDLAKSQGDDFLNS